MSTPRRAFGQQPGRLVSTMLRALAAELAEPGRYSRGKAYARDDAVIDISVTPGVARGAVQGTRSAPYVVELWVDPASDYELDRADAEVPSTLAMIVPARDELSVGCTCPDDPGSLCKHAVAVLLVLADEVGIEPELLVRWRHLDQEAGAPAHTRPGHAARRVARRSPSTGPPRSPAPAPAARHAPSAAPAVARVDVLAGLLDLGGELPELAPPPSRPLVGIATGRDELADLAHSVLVDALAIVRRHSPTS